MTIQVKVPVLPESVADASIATWHKQVGETVKSGENLVDIETDKVVLEVPAPEDGVLEDIITPDPGSTVKAGDVIAVLAPGAVAATAAPAPATPTPNAANQEHKEPILSPAVRKLIAEHNLNPTQITGSGKDGRILKEDVLAVINRQPTPAPAVPETPPPVPTAAETSPTADGMRSEKRVAMTRLRTRIAERLLEAQANAAILTTFNEVNMQPVMDLRAKYKDMFEKQHGNKLGFMSFFVKASVEALQRFPEVNASIDGDDIVYHGYCDIGVAVSSPRGLVVPILRNAEHMSMADVETNIIDFGSKAKNNNLSLEDLTGGTFTISNGGVFGSLLSTPILNPPQSAILGMHKIEQRPVAENGAVVIRPMMYLALSYDHRIIDGREAVQFLVTIKELLEDPARILLQI